MNIESFKNKFLEKIQLNCQLANFTWFGVGGKADLLYIVEDFPSLSNLLKNKPKERNVLIIGAGSNLLIRDKGFKGIVLLTKKLNKISMEILMQFMLIH